MCAQHNVLIFIIIIDQSKMTALLENSDLFVLANNNLCNKTAASKSKLAVSFENLCNKTVQAKVN